MMFFYVHQSLLHFFLYNSGFFSMCFKAYFFVILWASMLIPLLLHVVMVEFYFYMHCDISKHVSYKLLHTSHFRVTFCDIYSCKFPIPWYTTRIYFDIGLLVLFLLFESHSFLSNKYALVWIYFLHLFVYGKLFHKQRIYSWNVTFHLFCPENYTKAYIFCAKIIHL